MGTELESMAVMELLPPPPPQAVSVKLATPKIKVFFKERIGFPLVLTISFNGVVFFIV
jgi:hypothetical protein